MAERPSAKRAQRSAKTTTTTSTSPSKRGPVATARWTKAFLAALADSSNVAAAARHAGIDVSTAYLRRRNDQDFYRQWQIALCEGYDNLEMDLLHRLRTGELKAAAGAKRATRSFDNATALRLLGAHRESAVRERAVRAHVSAADIRAAIDRKVEELRKRVMDAKAERDAATAATTAPDLPALSAQPAQLDNAE
ncbi:MAG: hypothetical protein ACKVOL_00920 [Novosphingobium sp.]